MRWPTVHEIGAQVVLPAGYRCELLRAAEVSRALRFVDDSFPGLAVGNASCFLREEFYAARVHLAHADRQSTERDFLVLLFKHGEDWAALLAVERDRDSQVLYGRVGAVAEGHRGAGLSKCFAPCMETIGRSMGLGMVYSLATLKTPAMQRGFELAGWRLIGIMPGFDREVVAPGVVKRVFEAIYVKVLAPDADMLQPDAEGMRPATQALFDTLFPRRTQASSGMGRSH
jgi:hypothetical protein